MILLCKLLNSFYCHISEITGVLLLRFLSISNRIVSKIEKVIRLDFDPIQFDLGKNSRFDNEIRFDLTALDSTLTQMPHPMHSSSDMDAILSLGVTSMQSLPIRTTGHDLRHSCLHRFGLHLSELTIATRDRRMACLTENEINDQQLRSG